MVSETPDDGLDDRYLVQPVLKAMQVLQIVCDATDPVSLNQLVRAAALPKTTVFRYLRTLSTLGFIEHQVDTDRYRPGLGLWRDRGPDRGQPRGPGPHRRRRGRPRPARYRPLRLRPAHRLRPQAPESRLSGRLSPPSGNAGWSEELHPAFPLG